MNPQYQMFTSGGNQRVLNIFQDTQHLHQLGLFESGDQVWQYAYSRLELLGREPEFGEATDTEVRSTLWERLTDDGIISDWSSVNYWFYVDWLNLRSDPEWQDLFKSTVDSYNPALYKADRKGNIQ